MRKREIDLLNKLLEKEETISGLVKTFAEDNLSKDFIEKEVEKREIISKSVEELKNGN